VTGLEARRLIHLYRGWAARARTPYLNPGALLAQLAGELDREADEIARVMGRTRTGETLPQTAADRLPGDGDGGS
jgi:hypothetical protein